MFETLNVEIRGAIGELRLDRPEKLNPLSVRTLEEIAAACDLRVASEDTLFSTKRHVNAITEQMLGTNRSWSDADGLVAAFQDEESRQVRRDYLAARKNKGGSKRSN